MQPAVLQLAAETPAKLPAVLQLVAVTLATLPAVLQLDVAMLVLLLAVLLSVAVATSQEEARVSDTARVMI